MKGKFFYKIDYNTDNWKKQYRNSKVGKNYHNLEKSGSKPGKTECFWHYSPHFCVNFVRKQGFRIFRRKQEYDEEQQKQIEKERTGKMHFKISGQNLQVIAASNVCKGTLLQNSAYI